MNHHQKLSRELRSEAGDLRRYARELEASGDTEGAAAVRDQALHVEGWVERVTDLEGDIDDLRSVLEAVEGVDTLSKLEAWIAEREAEREDVVELVAAMFPPTWHNGRITDKPAESESITSLRRALEALATALGEDPTEAGVVRMTARASQIVERGKELSELDECHRAEIGELEATAEKHRARITELERAALSVPTSKESVDRALKSRKAAWLDEVLDRCPIPRDVTESVFALLERDDADWNERFPLIGRLSAALAEHVRPVGAVEDADPSDYLRPALVELLDALEAVDREDADAYPRLEAAIFSGRIATETDEAPPPVNADLEAQRQIDAREVFRAALERRAAAQRARAAMTADHPLQLAYEADLEAAYRAAKPKGKIPRRADQPERLDIEKAAKVIPDAQGIEIKARHMALVKAEVDKAEAELAAAKAAVSEAAAAVTPRTSAKARTLIEEVLCSSYSSQTAPATYARAMARIVLDSARAACPGIELELVEDPNPPGKLRSVKVYGNVELLDVEVIKRKGIGLVECVRLAYKYGANPRVLWPSLPHGFEETHGLDRFGAYKAKP